VSLTEFWGLTAFLSAVIFETTISYFTLIDKFGLLESVKNGLRDSLPQSFALANSLSGIRLTGIAQLEDHHIPLIFYDAHRI